MKSFWDHYIKWQLSILMTGKAQVWRTTEALEFSNKQHKTIFFYNSQFSPFLARDFILPLIKIYIYIHSTSKIIFCSVIICNKWVKFYLFLITFVHLHNWANFLKWTNSSTHFRKANTFSQMGKFSAIFSNENKYAYFGITILISNVKLNYSWTPKLQYLFLFLIKPNFLKSYFVVH